MRVKKFYVVIIAVFAIIFAGCDNSENELELMDEFARIANNSIELTTKSIKLPESGSALYFNGYDNFIEVPDHESLDLANEFTISAWIYIEEYREWASITTKGINSNNYTIHQSGPTFAGGVSGLLRFTATPTLPLPLPESNTVIPLLEWNYVAVSFDGEIVSFYLNGELNGQHAVTGPLEINEEPLIIGADFPGGDEFWFGCIDELRIWNKSLKKTHIKAAMTGHASPLASALVAYWRFDEGEGNIVYDKSKNKNHGTINGTPNWINAKD
jgi:hypothetical protein